MSKAKLAEAIENDPAAAAIEKAKNVWDKYNKIIMIAGIVMIAGAIGYIFLKNQKTAKNAKAEDTVFVGINYFEQAGSTPNPDSLYNLALNGDAAGNKGLLYTIKTYGGTDAGNLAKFYAGNCYLQLKDFPNAIKYLKDFSTDAKQIQARAYKNLGDAYAESGKENDAFDNYKKAAYHFTEDEDNSSEYMFFAAAMAQKLKKDKEAVEIFKSLKDKYPRTRYGNDAVKYLAQLGVYE
jgi:predicted negative regulator of RcsB-dependent stress response